MRLEAVELLKKRGVLISPDDGGTIEHLRKITPGRTCTLDPQYALNEHPAVAPGRTLLVGPTYNQRRHPLPRQAFSPNTSSIIFICGADHSLTFLSLLQRHGLNARIHCGDCTLELFGKDIRFCHSRWRALAGRPSARRRTTFVSAVSEVGSGPAWTMPSCLTKSSERGSMATRSNRACSSGRSPSPHRAPVLGIRSPP
jgi:hypothetical protein